MAKKVIKKSTKKSELTTKFKKVRGTAKTLNEQLVETAEVAVEEIRERGVQLREEAVERVKDAVDNFDLQKGVDKIKGTAKDVNNYTIKTADELIEGVVANGEKWQGVAEKAINGGFKLASKQQDIVFDSLETVKEQLKSGTSRLRKLFANNKK